MKKMECFGSITGMKKMNTEDIIWIPLTNYGYDKNSVKYTRFTGKKGKQVIHNCGVDPLFEGIRVIDDAEAAKILGEEWANREINWEGER